MCTSIQSNENSPNLQRSIIATAALAAISVLVCGILAILANCQIIQLPVNTLMIAGGTGAAFFGIISMALKCCGSPKKEKIKEQTDKGAEPNKGGNNLISHDGSGPTTGAKGIAPGDNVKVKHGERKEHL